MLCVLTHCGFSPPNAFASRLHADHQHVRTSHMTMVDSWYDAGQRLSTAAAMRAASPAAGGSSRLEAELESTKAALLKVALLSGRGAWARPSERVAAAQLVESLEQAAEQGGGEAPSLRDGTWELVLSDVEPFRASTFFLALGEAVEALIQKGASDGALTVHALATGGGEVGRVAHVVEGGGGFVCTCRSHAPRSPEIVRWQAAAVGSIPSSSSRAARCALEAEDVFLHSAALSRYSPPSCPRVALIFQLPLERTRIPLHSLYSPPSCPQRCSNTVLPFQPTPVHSPRRVAALPPPRPGRRGGEQRRAAGWLTHSLIHYLVN